MVNFDMYNQRQRMLISLLEKYYGSEFDENTDVTELTEFELENEIAFYEDMLEIFD